jgi:Ni,Fe-hydrogenase III small subunit
VPLVTGPVTHNMTVAVERAYTVMPAPKWGRAKRRYPQFQ